jgi:hypothetical protein
MTRISRANSTHKPSSSNLGGFSESEITEFLPAAPKNQTNNSDYSGDPFEKPLTAEILLENALDLVGHLQREIEQIQAENQELRRDLATTRWALVWSQAEPQFGERRWWQ